MPTMLARVDEKQIHKSPVGEARWAQIITPAIKYDPAGVYQNLMTFSPEDERAFLETLEPIFDAACEQARIKEARTQIPRAAPPWKEGKDGRLEFKFKLKASGIVDGRPWKTPPPKLYDSRAQLIENPDPDKFRIGNGSLIRVIFQVRPYFVKDAGITLRLKACQIIRLVEYDAARALGIEPEENGGYVHNTEPAPTPEPSGDAYAPVGIGEPEPEQPDNVVTDDDIPF